MQYLATLLIRGILKIKFLRHKKVKHDSMTTVYYYLNPEVLFHSITKNSTLPYFQLPFPVCIISMSLLQIHIFYMDLKP